MEHVSELKKRYLTPGNIDENARRLIPEGELRGPTFDLSRAALLILDMQAYFLSEESHAFVPDAAAILPGLKGLARRFEAAVRPVIVTKHFNTDENAWMMKQWWNEMIDPETPEAQLEPELEKLASRVLDKTQYDAFHCTPLEEILRDSGTEQIVVTGVMTHLCVETTARAAFVRGFAVFLPADGTATYNRDFHAAALLNLSHGVAQVTTVAEMLSAIERGGR
jgi:isochorismate hydrolase